MEEATSDTEEHIPEKGPNPFYISNQPNNVSTYEVVQAIQCTPDLSQPGCDVSAESAQPPPFPVSTFGGGLPLDPSYTLSQNQLYGQHGHQYGHQHGHQHSHQHGHQHSHSAYPYSGVSRDASGHNKAASFGAQSYSSNLTPQLTSHVPTQPYHLNTSWPQYNQSSLQEDPNLGLVATNLHASVPNYASHDPSPSLAPRSTYDSERRLMPPPQTQISSQRRTTDPQNALLYSQHAVGHQTYQSMPPSNMLSPQAHGPNSSSGISGGDSTGSGRPNVNRRSSTLDKAYVVRPDQERYFFDGAVFSVLWSEPAGECSPNNGSEKKTEKFTNVYLGGTAYTNIRRFVVIKPRYESRKSVCCPIKTYRGQGTTKTGIDPNQHAIIYTHGSKEVMLRGEENLTKKSLCMIPENYREKLDETSRIDFSSPATVEHNLRMKYHGRIQPKHMHRLKLYYDYENMTDASRKEDYIGQDFSDDSDDPMEDQPLQPASTVRMSQTVDRQLAGSQSQSYRSNYSSDSRSARTNRPKSSYTHHSSSQEPHTRQAQDQRRRRKSGSGNTGHQNPDRGRNPGGFPPPAR